jgi:3-methyladenine DNA glycosylase AlkC
MLGVETAQALLQALILMKNLYVNKTIQNIVNSLGRQKQQNFQGFLPES